MKDTKFLKAVCRRTGRRYGLEIKQFGTTWKVVNFIPLSEQEAAVMTSEIRQPSLSTNSNLIACDKCGSRLVGGCACAPENYGCTGSKEFNLQCIYCKEMQIDYSAAVLKGGYKNGDVIRLSQGQEVKINLPGGKSLSQIMVGVGWDPVTQGANMDVDSSVVMAGRNRSYNIIYFGNLNHPSGCVEHHGDNLTGKDDGTQGDDENISVYLNKVPSDTDKLYFVLNIYKCNERKQQFGDVKNMYIRLDDPVAHRSLIEYRVEANLRGFTALIIGMAYRQGGEWFFRAMGKGSHAEDIHSLALEVIRMG